MNPQGLGPHGPGLVYRDGRLFFGDSALDELAARFQTPLYVYNLDVARLRAKELQDGLADTSHLVCYAIKANTSAAFVRLFLEFGFGTDVVSGGELLCARKAGVAADKIVFSGVAKTSEEIELAVKEGVLSFNVESPGEIAKIRAAAKSQRRRPRISLRINPDIDAKTHPKIATGLHATKFGLETSTAYELAKSLVNDPDLDISGVSCHIGSQMLDLAPLEQAAHLVFSFADSLRGLGIHIQSINLGGGLGVPYHPNDVAKAPGIKRYGEMMARLMKNQQAQLILEPGRALVAESGLLLTKVIEVKKTGKKTFIMVDSGMNDLVRPALYDAYHSIVPIWRRPNGDAETLGLVADIVGPVCETGDVFATDRNVSSIKDGDLMAITHAGAYGFSMASHYNLRPKPAEVAISKSSMATIIRRRETIEELLKSH